MAKVNGKFRQKFVFLRHFIGSKATSAIRGSGISTCCAA